MKSPGFYAFLILLFSALPLQAETLYEESFSNIRFPLLEDGLRNYGGYGANTSPAGADGDLLAGSLNYIDSAGNALAASGKHVLVDADEESVTAPTLATVSNVHVLSTPWNVSGNTIWVSFVGRRTAGTTARFFNLGLRSSTANPTEVVAIGMPSNASAEFWRIYDRSGTSPSTFIMSDVPATTQVFMLARMEANVDNTDKERYTIWLNPRLDQAPDEAAGFTFTSLISNVASWNEITDIRLAAGGPTAALPPLVPSAWEVDEIRIATTRPEVTPYLTMAVTSLNLDANGAATIAWTAAPGAQDTVQWSTDLIDWESYPSSTRIHPAGAMVSTWTTPPSLLKKLYLRVVRTAPPSS